MCRVPWSVALNMAMSLSVSTIDCFALTTCAFNVLMRSRSCAHDAHDDAPSTPSCCEATCSVTGSVVSIILQVTLPDTSMLLQCG